MGDGAARRRVLTCFPERLGPHPPSPTISPTARPTVCGRFERGTGGGGGDEEGGEGATGEASGRRSAACSRAHAAPAEPPAHEERAQRRRCQLREPAQPAPGGPRPSRDLGWRCGAAARAAGRRRAGGRLRLLSVAPERVERHLRTKSRARRASAPHALLRGAQSGLPCALSQRAVRRSLRAKGEGGRGVSD
jgi:hypothetical protein